MSATVILGCVGVLLAAAAIGTATARLAAARPIVYGTSLVASVVALVGAMDGLLGAAPPSTATLPLGLPWLGAHFRVDPLAAFFLIVVNLGSAAASLYALGYGRHEPAPHRVLPFFPAFLAGMNLVVLADDAFTFLLSWEFMSLSSWALVMAHHRVRENVRAAYVYLIMASFGTLCLLLAFALLAGVDGAYGFEAMRTHQAGPTIAALVLTFALLGAGSKAGLVPLHVWLPLAHPAAPSHVSALMSGVMTKVAVYGFIRIVLDLAMAFQANQVTWAAALALTAALFHVFNHSLFKSLLFFGSGAVLTATGERDMEHLGGLIHRMPLTAFTFLVGCVAISALPPLNGFVSEWLTFQAILQSPDLPQWGLKILIPGVGALLALSAALAAACFVKAFGVTFLGRPRSPAAANAREVDRFSLVTMFAFAALCLLAGILPGLVIDGLAPVVSGLVGDRMPVQLAVPWLSIVPIAEPRSSYNGLLIFLFISLSASLAVYAIHRFASRALRRAPPWDCGFPDARPITQYTAGSFAQPIRREFGTTVFLARERVEMAPPGDRRPARLTVELRDLVWETLYAPVANAVDATAGRLNILQFQTIRRYLSLVVAALIALLLVLAIWI